MKLNEIIAASKAANEEVFGNVPDKRAAAIVKAALDEMARQIRAAEGPVIFPGFGKFVVRSKEIEKDGEKITQRRIVFRPAAGKAPGARVRKAKA